MGTKQVQAGVLCDISVERWFSAGEDLGPQGTFGKLETIFVVIIWGWGARYYWHLVGRNLECH